MLIIGNKVKKVLKHKYPLKAANDNVTKKDILDILFPDGCTEFAVADDNDLEILHANNPASNTKPYFVLCDQFKNKPPLLQKLCIPMLSTMQESTMATKICKNW